MATEISQHVARLESKDTPEGSQCYLHIYYDVSKLDEPRRMLMLQFTMKAIGELESALAKMPDKVVPLQLARAKGKFIHLSKEQIADPKSDA